jgi:glycine/D-amino acid oxidase-like deaminating enzyme
MQVMETTPREDASRYCAMMREVDDLDEVAPPLEGPVETDTCIVGGGYLGLWTAIEILRSAPMARVTLVETDICGSGASGRNSGMALGYWTKVEALVARYGAKEALRICCASIDAIDDIRIFAEQNGLDIEFARTGWLWGATCPAQKGRWASVMETAARLGGAPFRELDRNGILSLVRAEGYLAGALDESAATVHPAKLVRGLRRVALSMGVRIYERTRVTRLHRQGRPIVEAANGRVTCDRVVLAMNAWSLSVPELRSGILVITSDDLVSEPDPEFLHAHGWTDGPIVTDASVFVSGYRPTSKGQVVAGVTGGAIGFGTLRGQRFEGRTPRENEILRALAIAFPRSRLPKIASSWRGPIDRTRTGLPVFGHLPGAPRIFFGYGFSGNGIVGCKIGSRILASLAIGRDDEWASCGLVGAPAPWMPPEPVRYLGSHLVRWAVRQRDARDRQGRSQGLIGRRLAALAPGGIVTTRAD